MPEKKRFRNQEPGGRSLKDFLKWRATRNAVAWPAWIDFPKPHPVPSRLNGVDTLAVTYINHATVLIQTAGLNILTDPIWSERCSPLQWYGPKRIHAPGLALAELPVIDTVLVSHNHYDHLDLPTITELTKHNQPKIFTGLGNEAIIKKTGTAVNCAALDWWQSVTLTENVTLTYVPARHWSGRGLFDSNICLWGGFVITTPKHNIYFAGDTAYGRHFKQIQERFQTISLAILPIGAYEARWFMQDAHINPEEAVVAHQELNALHSLGVHFGTFADLADEGYEQPITDLAAALAKYQINPAQFRTLQPGQRWEISN